MKIDDGVALTPSAAGASAKTAKRAKTNGQWWTA